MRADEPLIMHPQTWLTFDIDFVTIAGNTCAKMSQHLIALKLALTTHLMGQDKGSQQARTRQWE